MNYAIDNCCILHGCFVCEGWSEAGPPALFYDGAEVPTMRLTLARTDLIPSLGPASAFWGFRLCAMFPIERPDHAKLLLRFADGTAISGPIMLPPIPEEQNYIEMMGKFAEATKHGGRLLEIGSRARSGNVYRSWLGDAIDYVGLDVTPGPNVDVVADAHHMSRALQGRFDFVFSISVFEHLAMPWKVALEMAAVMNQGALGLIQSHAAFPLHEEPWDFWRYSRSAWHGVFNGHTGFEVIQTGYAGLAWTVPAAASGSAAQNMDSHSNYLLSACLIRRIGQAKVRWDAEASEVFNMDYSHA